MNDAPIDAATGQVIYMHSGDVVRTFPAMEIDIELVSLDASGERTLARYCFDHTPFQVR
jgi:hypothetical protein